MNYSTNFGLKLPQRGVEMANVNDLNDNTEDIDTIMHQNRTMLGEAYDPDKIAGYTEGDFVVQLGQYYECLDDTSGAWDPTKWQLTDIGTVLKALANSGGGGGGGHTYSTQEQVVGEWIDGSDLYEITISTTSPSTVNTDATIATLTDLNYGQIVSIDGILYAQSFSQYIPIFWSYGTSLMGSVYVEGNNLKQELTNANYLNCPVWVTLRYTKSSS